MDLFVIAVLQLQCSDTQCLDFLTIGGTQTFEDTLGQRSTILEEAIHPGIGVGIEGKGRSLDTAATCGIGENRGCQAVTGRSAFELVKTPIENSHRAFDPF